MLGQAHEHSSLTRRLGLGLILSTLFLEIMCRLFDLMILVHKLIKIDGNLFN